MKIDEKAFDIALEPATNELFAEPPSFREMMRKRFEIYEAAKTEQPDPRKDCPWKCQIGDSKCLCAQQPDEETPFSRQELEYIRWGLEYAATRWRSDVTVEGKALQKMIEYLNGKPVSSTEREVHAVSLDGMKADWMWCYENPKEAAAEITKLREASASWQCEAAKLIKRESVEVWQPIETAPKDQEIIAYSAGSSMSPRERIDVVIWGDYCRHNNPKFSHWMPLPKPPTTEIEGGK
jgi:hypothetical protein